MAFKCIVTPVEALVIKHAAVFFFPPLLLPSRKMSEYLLGYLGAILVSS